MIWTDSYLNTVIEQAEKDISREISCIFYRKSLAVTSGDATVTLPDGIIGIIRLTWKGYKVDPADRIDFENVSNWKPNSTGSQSKPLCYLRTGYGYKELEFWPVPNETIGADDTNIYGSDIANRVIISVWKEAVPTDNSYLIPTWNRRNLLKYFTLWKAFLKEGKGQNLDAANYFKKKYEWELDLFKTLNQSVYSVKKQVLKPRGPDDRGLLGKKPARPSLPSSGAWSW